MRPMIAAIALWVMVGTPTSLCAAPPQYDVVNAISIGAPEDWDFLHFDPAQDRVYISHLNEIVVVDGTTGALVGRIPGISGAHDVAVVPELGRGYADNGETGDVTVFDLESLQTVGKIPADRDADGMVYDSVTKRLIVGSGDARDASIIDVEAGKKIATVPLGGTAEGLVADGAGRVFINVDTANEIVRLDLRSNKIDARWATPGCERPHGLAIDLATHRLFASCPNGKMIVLDATNGKALALLPIGLGTDSAAFDPVRKFAFSANKEGTLSVVAEQGSDQFTALGDIRTAPGAKNIAIDQQTGRIFLVTADVMAQHPPRRAGGPPSYDFKPGSTKLIVLDPVH